MVQFPGCLTEGRYIPWKKQRRLKACVVNIYRWHIQSRHFKRRRCCFAICSSQERWAGSHFIIYDVARFLDPPGFILSSFTTSQFTLISIAKDSVDSLLTGDRELRLYASAGFGAVRNAPIACWQTFEAGPDCKCLTFSLAEKRVYLCVTPKARLDSLQASIAAHLIGHSRKTVHSCSLPGQGSSSKFSNPRAFAELSIARWPRHKNAK